MNYKTLSFLLFIISTYSVSAQTDYLARTNTFLVGPSNVDVFYNSQKKHYIEKYENLLEEILFTKEINLEDIANLENKFLNKKKSFELIKELMEINSQIEKEAMMLDNYLELWNDWTAPKLNQEFLNNYRSDLCYQIDGSELSYFPGDYLIDTLSSNSQVSWNEKVDLMLLDYKFELEEITPASTGWEKKRADRNCLSADPNDCLVWYQVEIPATYDTIVIQEASYGCMEGFLFSEIDEQCERRIMRKRTTTSELVVKVMDVLTGREIKVKKFEVVECF